MTPFFFGRSTNQLLGLYDPPPGRSTRGAVLCHPWAREYLLAYPTMRQLARRLAETGWHVLRFDYAGTGDSAGDVTEVSPAHWVDDIDTALNELKDMAQLSQLALVGMRLGGTLAARAARRRRDVERLVLWDPVADGRAYLGELGVASPASSAGDVDAQGSVLTAAMRSEVEAVTPASFTAPLPRTLVLDTAPVAASRVLTDSLAAGGVESILEHVPDVRVWREEWGRGGVGLAVQALNRVVAWLS